MLIRYLYSRLIIAPDFWKCQNLLIDIGHIYGREYQIIRGLAIIDLLKKMDENFLVHLYSMKTLKEMKEEHQLIKSLIKEYKRIKKETN